MSGVPRHLMAALTVLLGACGSRPDVTSSPPPHRPSDTCPLQSPADWQRFLELVVADEGWVETCSDLDNCGELAKFAEHVETDVVDLLGRCASDLAENPVIAACTDRLRRYVPAWQEQHSVDSYGFRQSNPRYFAAQTGPGEPPGMMELPVELLGSFPERSRIEATARAQGWPYLTHDSCLGGARIFIAIDDAGDRFDRWMIVNLDTEAKRVVSPAIISFISVQKRNAEGAALPRVRPHFRDYWAVDTGDSWSLSLPDTLAGKCYACHASGMRLLLPARGDVTASAPVRGETGFDSDDTPPDFAMTRLMRFNERLLAYGATDWNDTVRPADHGPPLGRELGCTSCHDGSVRGMLTVSTSEATLAQKMVEQLSMRGTLDGVAVPDTAAMSLLERERKGTPPLSSDERAALDRARSEHERDYAHVMAERFPAWKAWILDRRCDEP
jgi:hypothetical protein